MLWAVSMRVTETSTIRREYPTSSTERECLTGSNYSCTRLPIPHKHTWLSCFSQAHYSSTSKLEPGGPTGAGSTL
eukprot:3029644-Amphidinium_carterae.1